MHAKLERLSEVRARHAKRSNDVERRIGQLFQRDDNAPSSEASVTGSGLANTGAASPTNSVDATTASSDTQPTSSSAAPSTATASSDSSTPSSTSSSVVAAAATSSSLVAMPMASVLTSKNSNATLPLETSGAVSSSDSPVSSGAIAGIVIALLLFLGVVVVFFARRIIKQKRQLQRTSFWQSKGFNPQQPTYGEKPSAPETAPFVSPTSGRPGDVSPGYVFAHAQAHSIASRVEPPKAPQMSYNNPIGATNSALAPGEVAPSIPYMTVTRTSQASANNTAFRVNYAFIPTLPDELSISTGETITIVAKYDDGWAMCENRAGDRGMVPLECLEDQGRSFQADGPNTKRESSLITSASRF